VAGNGLHLKDALLNGQEGHIKGSSTKIENEDVMLTDDFLVETAGDGSSSGLVDDMKNVHSRNGASIFCSLSLRVVEVGRDSNDSITDGIAQVGLSSLPYFKENHGRDIFRRKFLLFSLILHSDVWLTSLVENGEGEVLDVRLDLSIVELMADETISAIDVSTRNVKRGQHLHVVGVHSGLILGSITSQLLIVGIV
ncbi:NAD-specific glutamate dehydrogenase-domain-containing protein, partial [Suillus spraguei]